MYQCIFSEGLRSSKRRQQARNWLNGEVCDCGSSETIDLSTDDWKKLPGLIECGAAGCETRVVSNILSVLYLQKLIYFIVPPEMLHKFVYAREIGYARVVKKRAENALNGAGFSKSLRVY